MPIVITIAALVLAGIAAQKLFPNVGALKFGLIAGGVTLVVLLAVIAVYAP